MSFAALVAPTKLAADQFVACISAGRMSQGKALSMSRADSGGCDICIYSYECVTQVYADCHEAEIEQNLRKTINR